MQPAFAAPRRMPIVKCIKRNALVTLSVTRKINLKHFVLRCKCFLKKNLSRPKAALSSVSIKNTLEQMQGIVNPSARKRSTHPLGFNFHSSVAVHESPTAAGQRFVDSRFLKFVYVCCQYFLEATSSSISLRRKNHLRLRSVRDLTDGIKRLTACDLTLS